MNPNPTDDQNLYFSKSSHSAFFFIDEMTGIHIDFLLFLGLQLLYFILELQGDQLTEPWICDDLKNDQ